MKSHVGATRRTAAGLLVVSVLAAISLAFAGTASAAIVAKVPLATARNYSVLAGSTVTNTGGSVLGRSLGVSPGTAVTGFPPGQVVAPGTINKANAAASQAKADLTTAYVNAAGRPVNFTTSSNLANKHLQPGVYSGPSKSPLSLTGPLVLDGGGDYNSVFIFQTNSTLITASASTITLTNGAQDCNVFWQVGSSATLGTSSVFRGNILALTSITVNNGVVVHGRALARNGAVTLTNDVFTASACLTSAPATTTTTTPVTTPATTPVGGTPLATTPGGGTANPAAPGTPGSPGTNGGPGSPPVVGPPRTGGAPLPGGTAFPWATVLISSAFGIGTVGALVTVSRRALAARR